MTMTRAVGDDLEIPNERREIILLVETVPDRYIS